MQKKIFKTFSIKEELTLDEGTKALEEKSNQLLEEGYKIIGITSSIRSATPFMLTSYQIHTIKEEEDPLKKFVEDRDKNYTGESPSIVVGEKQPIRQLFDYL